MTPSTAWVACRTNCQRLYGRSLWDSRYQLLLGVTRNLACLLVMQLYTQGIHVLHARKAQVKRIHVCEAQQDCSACLGTLQC